MNDPNGVFAELRKSPCPVCHKIGLGLDQVTLEEFHAHLRTQEHQEHWIAKAVDEAWERNR